MRVAEWLVTGAYRYGLPGISREWWKCFAGLREVRLILRRERASMRKSIFAGLILALAAALVMWLSAVFDLELESVVLMGAAVGAVVALVPDRTPLARFLGFAAGFVAAWLGFFARAALLPDTPGGRAVAVGLVLLLCVAVAALSAGRVPLWSALLGAAAMSGGYEYTYAAAPPEVASTSVSAATSLLFCIAVGYLVAATVAPTAGQAGVAPRGPRTDDDLENTRFDDLMMEKTK
jgi:hypothetical protein